MTDVRVELGVLMRATLADEAAHHTWTYAAVRPLPTPPKPWHEGLIVRGDCSKGVQWLCWWAGAPDPMGNSFGPYGNSQTIWSHLQHLDSATELLVGDVITFGYAGGEHATMVLEAGPDPLMWSFGRQGTPDSYRLSWERRARQYLRLPVVYVPTPDERLRAMTGWFSWVAWRLGEGDWAKRGKANAAVRPSVPARIPLEWWTRYARFVANRRRGG